MIKKEIFDKRVAKVLYSWAVIMMVGLHVLKFPERIKVEYLLPNLHVDGVPFEYGIGIFCGMCVGIFAFLSGYGLYLLAEKNSGEGLKQRYTRHWYRLKDFYKIYWLIFILFIPYGLLKGIFKIDMNHLIQCFIGKAARMNIEWWYVWMYVKILFLTPLFFMILNFIDGKMSKIKDLYKIILWYSFFVICVYYLNASVVLVCALLGVIFAKYRGFDIAYNQLDKLKCKTLMGIGLLVLDFYGFIFCYNHFEDITYKYLKYDIFFVPLFIFINCLFLQEIRFFNISKYLVIIGKYSVYIWLIHSFFCYYYWQDFALLPKYGILVSIWVLLLSFITGYIINKVFNKILN